VADDGAGRPEAGSGEEPAPSDLLAARRAKLESLRSAGIDPFPHEFDGVEPVGAVRTAHERLADGEETSVSHRVAGRLAARRGQGKMAFLDLVDRSGRIQLQARLDVLGEERMERRSGRGAASSRCASRTTRCWPSRCGRRPTSTTACRTSRPACATASST
jgi:hypothetical protein